MTVVVTCYNYGRYLRTCVESCLAQEGVDLKVVIVDDASSDDSASIARDLAEFDDRVSVLIHRTNRGYIASINDGVASVDTEYVLNLNADDILAAGCLRRACALMEAHPRVGLVQGKAVIFTNEEGPRDEGFTKLNVWTIWSGEQWIEKAARLGRNLIMSPEAVMRTAAVREAGGYDMRMHHTSDLHMWLRTAARWDVGWLRGVVQAYYRNHGENMHTVRFGTDAADFSGLLDAFGDLDEPVVTATLRRGPELKRVAYDVIGRRALTAAEFALEAGDRDALEELLAVAVRADPSLRKESRDLLSQAVADA